LLLGDAQAGRAEELLEVAEERGVGGDAVTVEA
jgi:hypothetical protein